MRTLSLHGRSVQGNLCSLVLPMDSDDDLIVSHMHDYIAQSFCDGKSRGQPGNTTQFSDTAVSYLAADELNNKFLFQCNRDLNVFIGGVTN